MIAQKTRVVRYCLAAACISIPHKGSVLLDKNKLNVLGTVLESCGGRTGYYRDGYCASGPEDRGVHVVCSEVTQEFLDYSKSRGNDLLTPHPEFDFKGLKPGDRWCLCASRWKEAFDHGVAPPVILEATHERAGQYITLKELQNKCAK